MPIVRPRDFPIRRPSNNQQTIGQVHNQPRYPEQGGLTSPAALGRAGSLIDLAPVGGQGGGKKAGPTED